MPTISRERSAPKREKGRQKLFSITSLGLLLLFSLALLWGCASGKVKGSGQEEPKIEESAAVSSGPAQLTEVVPEMSEGRVKVKISSDGELQYTAFKLNNPLRLVLDIGKTSAEKVEKLIKVEQGAVENIKTNHFPQTGTSRIELLLNKTVPHEIVRKSQESIVVYLGEKEEEKEVEEKVSAVPPLMINDVDFFKLPEGKSRVLIRTEEGTPKFTIVRNDLEKKLILDIENGLFTPEARKEMSTEQVSSVLQVVHSYQFGEKPPVARVVMGMSRMVAYNVYRDGGDIYIDFSKAPLKEPKKVVKTEKDEVAEEEERERLAAIEGESPKKKYEAKLVSMDFQDADILTVLKLIAEVSDMNIITGKEVKGKVTMRLVNVPWEQALDVILKSAKLGMVKEGNIIRIAPSKKIIQEMQEQAAAQTAELDKKKKEEELEEVFTEVVPVNYATASELLPILEKNKSGQGDITIDKRTNSLLITDTKKRIAKMLALVETLDRRTPQVLIEARIVEVNKNYTKDLGIEWGGKFGATTKQGFPAAVGVAGSSGPGIPGGATGGTAVSLPAAAGAGTGGAVTATLGSLSGTAALDLRLSALESSGKARILSTPKIVTSDNKEAIIESGKSIPYATVSDSGTSVQFVDATISLKVTPHITSDGFVSMSIEATKNEADFGNLVQGTPSIIRKTAKTEVLIRDGDTTVIGGLYKTTTSRSEAGVPWLSKIPILGWFFKKKANSEIGEELLIFITPLITHP